MRGGTVIFTSPVRDLAVSFEGVSTDSGAAPLVDRDSRLPSWAVTAMESTSSMVRKCERIGLEQAKSMPWTMRRPAIFCDSDVRPWDRTQERVGMETLHSFLHLLCVPGMVLRPRHHTSPSL